MKPNENKNNDLKKTLRIEACSDGVFAIAIALLIQEINMLYINITSLGFVVAHMTRYLY